MGRLVGGLVVALVASACVFDSSGLPKLEGPASTEGRDAPADRRAAERRVDASLMDRPVLDQPPDQLQPDYGPPPPCTTSTTCPFWAPWCCAHGDGSAVCATVTTDCACGAGKTTCIWPFDRCCDPGGGRRCRGWWELTCF